MELSAISLRHLNGAPLADVTLDDKGPLHDAEPGLGTV